MVLGGEFVYPRVKNPKTNKLETSDKFYSEQRVEMKNGDSFMKYQLVMRVEDVATGKDDSVEFIRIETGSLEMVEGVRGGVNYEVSGSLKIGHSKDGKTFLSVRPKSIAQTT